MFNMKINLAFFIVIILTKITFSQNIEWNHYTYEGYRIYALKSEHEFMWVGTDAGFVRININNGETKFYNYQNLPSQKITSIAIDSKGNKWFGSVNGLIKYDNSSYDVYRTSNSQIPNNYITDISIDNKDNIWVGTWDGIAKFDGNEWNVFKPSNSGLPDHDIKSITIDRNNVIWIGTANSGVVRFDGKEWSVYNTNNSILPDNLIESIIIDDEGIKWFISSSGKVTTYNDTTWEYFQVPDTIGKINYITFGKNGIKWLATLLGVVKIDGVNYSVFNNSNSTLPMNEITRITLDEKGDPWVGNDHLPLTGHLHQYDGTTWISYNTNSSSSCIKDYPILSIAIDSNNVKWITTRNGIAKYDNGSWINYNMTNSGLPSNSISEITVDIYNNKWFASSVGLVKYDNHNWKYYQNDAIQSVAIDQKNHKWVVSYYEYFPRQGGHYWGNNLLEFNDSTWINHTQKSNYTIGGEWKRLNSVYADDKGFIWIGTNNGLIKYDGNNQTLFNMNNSNLPSNVINYVTIDKYDNKWIATNNGLVIYNNSWTIFNKSNSGLPSDTVNSIVEDKNGNKWILTAKGLAKYDNLNWETYNQSNSGLYSDQTILCLAIDMEMNKWIGAYGDLIEYFGDKQNDFIEKEIMENNFYLFQNYPNPFNSSTKIRFWIKESNHVTIKIYDILGREISIIINNKLPAGNYETEFTANRLSSGVYFCHLYIDGLSQTIKMILLR
jgi:ligand-binding sensor domain-containing protein